MKKLSVSANRKGDQIAALISPQLTLEEQFMAQKLIRGLGSNNIDHRLNQVDFSAQNQSAVMPWLGRSLKSLETLNAALIVGGNLRHEQPILSHRLRKAVVGNTAEISSIGHVTGQNNYPMHAELGGSAAQLVLDLGSVVVALANKTGVDLSPRLQQLLEDCKPTREHKAIAQSLNDAPDSALIVGVQVLSNPALSMIQELCETIATQSNSSLGYLSPAANSAGACLSGCLPHRQLAGSAVDAAGQNAYQILGTKHQVLLTLGVNPILDISQGKLVNELGDKNDFIIAINSFNNQFIEQQADLVLPLSCFTETSGTYVNTEGLWQSFNGCVKAPGESRQGWKILASLGKTLLPGDFDYADTASIRNEVKEACRELNLDNFSGIKSSETRLPSKPRALQKISHTPIYASDDLTRLAAPLQSTPLTRQQCVVAMNSKQAKKLKFNDADQVQIRQGSGTAVIPVVLNENIPDDCVSVPVGIEAVKNLDGVYGTVELEKVS